MRIVGGALRGRRLATPADERIRPTSDKVRQAVFNALESRGVVQGAVVLDAFCGTGALGIEALSRGAGRALFCDHHRESLALARENVTAFGLGDRAVFVLADASAPSALPAGAGAADLVFLDPPYRMGLVPKALEALSDAGWIAPDALVVAECEAGASLGRWEALSVWERSYGETRVVMITLEGGGE